MLSVGLSLIEMLLEEVMSSRLGPWGGRVAGACFAKKALAEWSFQSLPNASHSSRMETLDDESPGIGCEALEEAMAAFAEVQILLGIWLQS